MEKEHQLTRRDFLRLSGAVTAAVVLDSLVRRDALGVKPSGNPDYSHLDFQRIVVDDKNNPAIPPQNDLTNEFSSPPSLSKEEKKKFETKQELKEIVEVMRDNSDTFPTKYVKDVEIYYPIYKEAADKYKIDWYLLFIVHEAETGASAGTKGFAPNSYYVGAMQRDPNIWSDSYVNESADGLESLAKLPQRHEDDWKEIAAAAHMLSDNFYKYRSQGDSKNEAVLKALLLYSADEPAKNRFKKYEKYQAIFSEEIIRGEIASKAY